MQNIKCKKRINRIIAGLVSAAMAFTMVPDVWLPVHAEIVSNQIKNADIGTAADRNELDKYSYTKYEFNGNTYAFIENEMLWNEAREVCEKLGGHLAYINSEAEQEFITEITKNYYTALGGLDELSEGEWTWLDGSEMTFTNWRSGEPNNSYPHQNHLYINYSGAGKWDDGYDNRMAPFVCEWENDRSEHNVGILSEYTIFSSNINEDITLNGWKSSITGGIYSGRDFICNLSEFYLDGKADTVGAVTANGWKINIPEKNENIEAAAMPDLEEAMLAKAGEYTYYSESPSYIQDTNIINGSIMVSGDVIISGTNFEGDCYIIADGDIVYNVNALNTTGRLVLYSRNGNITVNGTNININGIMYAPKGNVSFNANETTVNGRIWADNVNFSGSIFNIKGSEDDLDLIGDTDIETPTEYSVLSQGESKYGYKHEFVENEWSLGKDTTFGTAMIELVPNEYNKSGFSYYRISKRLEDNFSFSARFTFSIDYTTSLADGLAFVIQTDDTLAGTIGKGIGYGNISPSLAVEFDDYRNNEPNGNHIGVMLNGNCDKHYAIYDYEELNNNGAVHDVWIEYDGVNKMLYVAAAQYDENGNVNRPQQAMISYNIDLNELLAGQEYVYFGITSATGSSRASHKLHGVEFDPSPDSLYYADEPVIDITASSDKVNVGEEAYFTVNATHEDKIKDIGYTLNGMPVTVSDGKYTLDTAEEGTYTFEANAVTSSGKNISASAAIEVVNSGKPIVDLIFDKDSYAEGDDVIVTVTATDETGIGGMALEYDGLQAELDENNSYTVKKITAGKHTIVGIAWNTAGAVSSAEYEITINPKGSEPADELTLNAEIDTSKIKVGEPFDINITAKGGVGEKKISCTVNSESIPVIDSKASYTPAQAGTYEIVISAVDEAGSSVTKTITLTVSESGAGTGEKTVTVTLIINNDRLNDGEHNEAKVGDEVSVFVEIKNLSDDEIESLVVTVNGKEIILDADKKAVYIPEKAGEYLFNAVLTAKDGNVSDLKYMLYVTESGSGEDTDEPDESELFVEITSPDDVKEITAPTDIIGSAKGSGPVKYTLEYAPAGTNEFTAIREGAEAVDGGVLGQLDPTMLRNGYYDIRLTGYTGKAHKSDIVTVYVTGQMKIGNFSIAFQDMDVNVPGLALTVVRGYDSRDKAKSGDFGYGWNLSMTSADISESGKPSENWSQTQGGGMVTTFRFTENKAHEVSIDWGSGKTEKFRMTLSPNSSLTPITAGITVSYKAQRGTKSTLEPINKTSAALIYNDDTLMYADGTPYAPAGYKLTKQDGTVYYFDADGNVTKIIDTNGSTIEMTYDGIIHSDGKSINYNRDNKGRITSIVSPTGKTVEYTYDNNGDLTAVKDVSGYVTRFEYDDHYITNIIDPRGVNVSRNIYDDNGRLIKTIDSDGNEIAYDHDIDGRQEVITDRNGNITLYVYDDNGNVLSQTDPNGNTVKNSYDPNGNLDKTVDALGNVTDYGYSESGDLLTLTDAEGHTVNNSYNSKGQLTSINAMGINTITVAYDDKGNTTSTTDAMGNDIDYSYDSKGQLTSVTDEIGSYMNMTYDSNGNVVSATNGAGTTTQFTYDTDGNCTSKTLTYTSEEGVKSVTENYFYDAAGNLIKIIDSEGNVTTTEYNSMGKVSSATDEKGRKTSYDYDDFGNLVKITYPDNTTETFTYDREGNNLSATDRMGRTVTMKYDKVGNLVSKTYPNGAGVSYVYDANYNLVSETSASGGVTYYEYDKIGRNTAIVDALGNRTAFFYNAKSQLESMTDPMGRTYTYSYDDNGNRIKTTYPDSTSVSSVYDARGRVTRQTDQHGYNTYYVYDGADRLIRVTNAQGISTSYTYDEVGNMTSVTDGNGNVTAYAYDDFGRVVKTTNALGNSAYTTYDKSGNVLTTTDYAGSLTSYTYDSLDRVSSKTTPDGTVSFAYTADGKISTVTDNSGVTSFAYDNMDGLTRVDYPDGNYVSYGYDNACRLTKVTTPFGSTSYEYDLLDRLTRVVDRNGYATVYEYDANGNRTAVHYANGFTTTYEYDLLNRLICEKTVDNRDNVVVQYVYTLGAAGERKSVTELDRTVEYSYDSLYRLTSETITEGEKTTVYTYAYDNVSNRILKTVNGEETVYTYNALNQLVSDSETSYEYDLNGNLVRVIGSAQSALYEYNSENKLIKATVQNDSLVIEESYTYDYQGNRTSKTTHRSDGVTEYVKYLNDNSRLTNVLAEIDSDGNALALYTVGADLVSQERSGRTSIYLYDGHGSVVGLSNESGVVTDTYCYDAFGNLLKSKGSTKNCYRYCGEQFDESTGLYYLRARYMDTSTGRFISQDSYAGSIFDPISLHKYLYANANPVMYSDPSGYASIMGKVVELAAKAELAIAEMMYNQTALVYWSMFTGALIAAGDVVFKGNFTPEELIDAMFLGAIGGFVAVFCGVFFHGMILAALAGLGVIAGFAGAVDSFLNEDYWQALYRGLWAVVGAVSWYKAFANEFKTWLGRLGKNQGANTVSVEIAAEQAKNAGIPRENHKVFAHNENHSLPAKGQEPFSSADLLGEDGSVKQRRYYDWEGKAEMDIDYYHTDDGTHDFPHIHIWDWSKIPPRQDSRR